MAKTKEIRVQKAKMLSVIKREHDLVDGLYTESASAWGAQALASRACENPGHCAIGALLAAAGVGDRYLRTLKGVPENWPRQKRAARVLRAEYGLTPQLAERIMTANDASVNGSPRRARVLRVIRRMPDRITA